MEIYQVIHTYDVDGGFGDAVGCEDVIATFEKAEDAEAFVNRYSNGHVYDIPYAELEQGSLYYKAVDIISHKEFDLERTGFDLLYNDEAFDKCFEDMDDETYVRLSGKKPYYVKLEIDRVDGEYIDIKPIIIIDERPTGDIVDAIRQSIENSTIDIEGFHDIRAFAYQLIHGKCSNCFEFEVTFYISNGKALEVKVKDDMKGYW